MLLKCACTRTLQSVILTATNAAVSVDNTRNVHHQHSIIQLLFSADSGCCFKSILINNYSCKLPSTYFKNKTF